jgi:hypothetical protein
MNLKSQWQVEEQKLDSYFGRSIMLEIPSRSERFFRPKASASARSSLQESPPSILPHKTRTHLTRNESVITGAGAVIVGHLAVFVTVSVPQSD